MRYDRHFSAVTSTLTFWRCARFLVGGLRSARIGWRRVAIDRSPVLSSPRVQAVDQRFLRWRTAKECHAWQHTLTVVPKSERASQPAQDPLLERLENAESAGPLEDDVLAEIETARAEIRRGDFVIDQRTVKPAV